MEDKKVEVVVGYACNNRCLFCSVVNRAENKPTEQVKHEIDLAASMRPYEINLTGGEPTIRRDLKELIAYASEKVKTVRITTNGRMLSYREYTKALIESGLAGAIFSVHGAKANTHDYLVSVPGAYEQMMRGLDEMSKYDTIISINTVVTSVNYREITEMTEDLLNRYDVSAFCFIYPTSEGRLLENTFLLEKYETVVEHVMKAVEMARSVGVPAWILGIPPCKADTDEEYIASLEYKTVIIWDESEITDLDSHEQTITKYVDKCRECKYRGICPGYPAAYLERFPP